MINFKIKENEWKHYGDIELVPNMPYWCKKSNGDILLISQIEPKWYSCFINESGNIEVSKYVFHMSKNTKLQPAWNSM